MTYRITFECGASVCGLPASHRLKEFRDGKRRWRQWTADTEGAFALSPYLPRLDGAPAPCAGCPCRSRARRREEEIGVQPIRPDGTQDEDAEMVWTTATSCMARCVEEAEAT